MSVSQPNLHSWSFEPWLIIDEALVCAVPALLSTWGLLDAFDIDDAALLRFASAIRGRYTDSNSFHNFYHALGTFQVRLIRVEY